MGLRLESKENREAPPRMKQLLHGSAGRTRLSRDCMYRGCCGSRRHSFTVLTKCTVEKLPGTAVHTSDLSSSVNNITVYDTQSHLSYDPRMTDQASSVINSDLDNDNIPPYRQVHSDSSASSQCSLTVAL